MLATSGAMCFTMSFGVACAPGSDDSMLEFWAAGAEGEVVAQLLPAFEASHPGVRVHLQKIPWLGAHEKLLTAIVGESTPDVAQIGNTWIPEFATIGALDVLDDELERTSTLDRDDYFPGTWATNVYEQHTFGVPWYADTRVLFYRRDLLQEAGFSRPPRTWQEWLDMLEAIQEHGPPGRMGLLLPLYEEESLLALAVQEPDPLLRDGDRYGNFESPGFTRALEFYASLFQRGLAPRLDVTAVANLWDEFARGAFVFFLGGPFNIGQLKARLPPALQGSWATAPLPGREGPGASLAFGASLVVFERSQKKPAAWQLIEYLSQPDVQRRFYRLSGDLPPRRSSWVGPPLESDPHARAFREQLERTVPTPKVPEWERISNELGIVGERAARGMLSVPEATAELDARADRVLEKRRWLLDRTSTERAREPAAE